MSGVVKVSSQGEGQLRVNTYNIQELFSKVRVRISLVPRPPPNFILKPWMGWR